MKFEIYDVRLSTDVYKIVYTIEELSITMHIRIPLENWEFDVEATVRADIEKNKELFDRLKEMRKKYIGKRYDVFKDETEVKSV